MIIILFGALSAEVPFQRRLWNGEKVFLLVSFQHHNWTKLAIHLSNYD